MSNAVSSNVSLVFLIVLLTVGITLPFVNTWVIADRSHSYSTDRMTGIGLFGLPAGLVVLIIPVYLPAPNGGYPILALVLGSILIASVGLSHLLCIFRGASGHALGLLAFVMIVMVGEFMGFPYLDNTFQIIIRVFNIFGLMGFIVLVSRFFWKGPKSSEVYSPKVVEVRGASPHPDTISIASLVISIVAIVVELIQVSIAINAM